MTVMFTNPDEISISDVMNIEKNLILSKGEGGKKLSLTVDVRNKRKLEEPASVPFSVVLLLNSGLQAPIPLELFADSGLFQIAPADADPSSVRFSFGTCEADGVYATVRTSDLEQVLGLLFETELATANFLKLID